MASEMAASSSSPEAVQHAPDSSTTADPKASRGARAADKIRRRNRTINSCLECRRRKLKCDKTFPCASCSKFGRECKYLPGGLENPDAARKIAHLKEQMAEFERNFEEQVGGAGEGKKDKKKSKSARTSSIPGLVDTDSSEDGETLEDERDLEPTPLATLDAAYYEDADDDLMDLGVKFGKFRMTERIGGFVRPKMLDELKHYAQEPPPFNAAEAAREQRIKSATDYLGPTTQYVAPSSSFIFGGDMGYTSIDDYLFEKPGSDLLIQQYFEAVHYMCRVVHRPTFERQYENFWRHRASPSHEPAPANSFIAMMMAAMLSAVISMSEEQVASFAPGQTQTSLVDHFRKGAEFALSRANFIRTTKLETLQAFVMYLIPLCRAEVSRAHSALTGMAIRLAECMGLHRDGTHYGLRPVETHVRRLVWYQLCFLDFRTCEATGPRPQIRSDDFDTKFPLNVDDHALESSHPPYEDAERWTDCTFSRIRFECNEMQRLIQHDLARVEAKKLSLTSLLGKVKHFWDAAERKYLPMLDKQIDMHLMALLTYRALSYKMNIRVLHRYCSNSDRIMPERLRQVLLSSGLAQLEHSIAIETSPRTQKWAWYAGAFQQYHTALLILGEMYSTPQPYQHKDRAWKCLDFVFDLQPEANEGQKSRTILTELARRMEVYQRYRKVRAPTAMDGRAGPRPVPSILMQQEQERTAGIPTGGYVLANAVSKSPVALTSPLAESHSDQSLLPSVSPPTNLLNSPLTSTMASGPLSDPQISFGAAQYSSGNAAQMAYNPFANSGIANKPFDPSSALQGYALSPAGQSDSSGPSVGTASAGTQFSVNVPGIASAGLPAEQAQMARPGGSMGNVGTMDAMDIDWDEMEKLYPASQWEGGDFPLSNMGIDFGLYPGMPETVYQ